jgi:hypothetical protein
MRFPDTRGREGRPAKFCRPFRFVPQRKSARGADTPAGHRPISSRAGTEGYGALPYGSASRSIGPPRREIKFPDTRGRLPARAPFSRPNGFCPVADSAAYPFSPPGCPVAPRSPLAPYLT